MASSVTSAEGVGGAEDLGDVHQFNPNMFGIQVLTTWSDCYMFEAIYWYKI